MDCKQYISERPDPPKNQILKYDALSAKYFDLKQFFSNKEEKNCEYTCKTLKKGCK